MFWWFFWSHKIQQTSGTLELQHPPASAWSEVPHEIAERLTIKNAETMPLRLYLCAVEIAEGFVQKSNAAKLCLTGDLTFSVQNKEDVTVKNWLKRVSQFCETPEMASQGVRNGGVS
jgi:hypothetical protein